MKEDETFIKSKTSLGISGILVIFIPEIGHFSQNLAVKIRNT